MRYLHQERKAKEIMKIGKLYQIDWIDSANHAIGWEEKIGVEVAVIGSFGMLVAKNKKAVTLVQNVCYDGPGSPNGCNAISIPRGCIKSIKQLKVKKCKS